MPPTAVVAHLVTPLLGVSTGLRTFTPLAVTAWFAQMGKLPVKGTWASWIGHPVAVGLFTTAAMGEYIGDKLPGTPNRTDPAPLMGRIALGGLIGAVIAATFKRPLAGGIAMGAVGALAGSFGGFYARRGLVKGVGMADVPVAIAGDAAALALAIRSLRRLTA